MNDIECGQNADFLSIALEEFEHENYEMVADFVSDVCINLADEEEVLAQELQMSIDKLNESEFAESKELIEGVYENLLEEL